MANQYVVYPSNASAATTAIVEFNLDGTPTAASENTANQTLSKPLPVQIINTTTGARNTVDVTSVVSVDAALSNMSSDLSTILFDVEGIGSSVNGVLASIDAMALDVTTAANSAETIAFNMPSIGQQASAASMSVVATSDGWPLPTGASTSALQTTGNTTLSTISGKLPATLGQKTMSAALAVSLASDQSAIPASQSGTWNVTNVSGTVSLPTGASTSALQTTGNTSLSSIDGKLGSLGQKTMSGSAPVVISSDQSTLPVTQAGRTAVGKARNDYGSVNVTTSAYVQLIASTGAAVKEVEIFDSSGQTLVLATGAAASEVDQVYIFPGGNGRIPLAIAASVRISIKAVSATANSGEISMNLYG